MSSYVLGLQDLDKTKLKVVGGKGVEDRDKIRELSGEIRRVIEEIAIPEDINEEITRFVSKLGRSNGMGDRRTK